MGKYLRKAERRKLKEADRGIVDFMKITKHFFKDLQNWINEMIDPRNQSYIKYTQSDLVMLGLLKNVCAVESMCQMEEKFNEKECIKNLSILSGNKKLNEMPNYGTLNYYLEKLSPECLSEIRKRMINSLIRSKAFNTKRLKNKYWIVVLDGTGLFHFKERHCENCLITKVIGKDGKERLDYYHKVLEAKIILSDDIVLSLGTEFIENENENVTKQDCELNAAKRLLLKIKKQYPRLKICILGDSLYSVESIMGICRKNKWEYILNTKVGRQKNLCTDYEWLSEGGAKVEVNEVCKEKGKAGFINHVEEITGKKEAANIFEYEYKKKKKEDIVTIHFTWISSIEINENEIEEMVLTGRKRWKIENEGFNNQKNGIYNIEHLNSLNSNAMKNHYLLTQIADILMQLYLATNKLAKKIKQSIKNTSSRLLESFRQHTITNDDVFYISKYTTVHLE